MTATNQDFTLKAGDDSPLSWTVYSDIDNTVVLNLTGCTAIFYLKTNFLDATPVLQINGVIDTPASGVITLDITDTQSATLHGNYVYELKITDALAKITTVATGYITFIESTRTASTELFYCTPEEVSAMIRLASNSHRVKFDATTDPSYDEVLQYIRYSMGFIEQFTKDSWREQHVVDYYYTIPNPYYHVYPRYVTIPLKHRNIVKFESIKVFQGGDGADFKDWVALKTMGRGSDYYFDGAKGMLFMKWLYPWFIGQNALLLSYTYGNSVTYNSQTQAYSYNIPYDIRDACAKHVALRIMENDFERAVLVDGVSFDPSRSRVVDQWRKDIDLILRRRTVWGTVGVL
jgi:hypothetical protein